MKRGNPITRSLFRFNDKCKHTDYSNRLIAIECFNSIALNESCLYYGHVYFYQINGAESNSIKWGVVDVQQMVTLHQNQVSVLCDIGSTDAKYHVAQHLSHIIGYRWTFVAQITTLKLIFKGKTMYT